MDPLDHQDQIAPGTLALTSFWSWKGPLFQTLVIQHKKATGFLVQNFYIGTVSVK